MASTAALESLGDEPPRESSPHDEDASSTTSSSLDEADVERLQRLCGILFSWVCQNCTQPNPVATPSSDMLEYADAVGRRIAAARDLSMARAVYSRRAQAYAAALSSSSAGVASLSDFDNLHFSASSGSVRDADDSSADGGVDDRRAAFVRMISARGSAEVDATLGAVRQGAATAPLPPPSRPDFDALEAALPPVPAQHPVADPALLAAQSCRSCGAGYTAPTAPHTVRVKVLDSGGEDAAAAALATSAANAMAVDEAAVAVERAGVISSSGISNPSHQHQHHHHHHHRSHETVPSSTNLSILLTTLCDDDPAGYLSSVGLDTADALQAVLRAPPSSSAAADKQSGCTCCIVYDEAMLLHEEDEAPAESERGSGAGALRLSIPGVTLPEPPHAPHPERPDRLRAIAQHLVATGLFQRCLRVPSRDATREELATVHDEQHLQGIEALPALLAASGGKGVHFGSDTFANAHSLAAAKLSCGSVLAATEAVMDGRAARGIAVVRPPGHHAEEGEAMGFCLYNNVGVAAAVARQRLGAPRVLIVDWDVHHGNGTQHMFEYDPTVLYVSLHRHDGGTFYPGTGAAEEVGKGPGLGYTLNIPWACGGMGDAEYLAAFDEVIMPVAQSFAPDLVLVSAGFDAARDDPLGGCDLTPVGYAHMTHRLLSLARGRVVVALEGGYNLTSISRGMEAVVRVLLGEAPPPFPRFTPAWLHAVASNIASGHDGSEEDEEGAGITSTTAAAPAAAAVAGKEGAGAATEQDAPSSASAAATAAVNNDTANDESASTSGSTSSSSSSSASDDEGGASQFAAGKGRHSLAKKRADAIVRGSGSGANNSSSGAAPVSSAAPHPRANAFYLPSREAETLNSLAEGMKRGEFLEEQVPAASAMRTIVEVLAQHASFWPVLRSKYRAFAKRALLQQRLASTPVAVAGAATAATAATAAAVTAPGTAATVAVGLGGSGSDAAAAAVAAVVPSTNGIGGGATSPHRRRLVVDDELMAEGSDDNSGGEDDDDGDGEEGDGSSMSGDEGEEGRVEGAKQHGANLLEDDGIEDDDDEQSAAPRGTGDAGAVGSGGDSDGDDIEDDDEVEGGAVAHATKRSRLM